MVAVVVIIVALVLMRKKPEPAPQPSLSSFQQSSGSLPVTNGSARVPTNLLNAVRAGAMSDGEKADIGRLLQDRFKAAIDKWFGAYQGRIPFRPEDVSMSNFVERLGKDRSFYLYTFVMNGITFTIEDANGSAKVFYMMTRSGAADLNKQPQQGGPANIQAPVGKQDVVRMVKADTGTEFKPSDVMLRPTGLGTSINGGAFVDIGPRGGNPNIGPYKISLVFGPTGELVSYQRDPFF